MAIEEMILLNMTFDRRDLDQVLFTLKDSKYFYPQPASKIVNNVKGVHALQEDNAYTKLLDRLIQVASDMKLDLNKDLAPDKTLNFDKTNQYLSELEAEIKKIKDVQDQLITEKDENEKTYHNGNSVGRRHSGDVVHRRQGADPGRERQIDIRKPDSGRIRIGRRVRRQPYAAGGARLSLRRRFHDRSI